MTISFSAESFGRDGYEFAAPNAAPADDTDYLAGDSTWKTIPAGGASVATDSIWDAVGDLAIGSGNNTSVRLPRGTANQVLRVNSAGTNIEWVTDEVTQAELDSIAASLLNHLNDSLDAHAASAISYNAGTVASALTALESETLDWGNIGGTIGDQTDLIALVATKQDADANLDIWASVTPGTGVAAALAINIGSAGAPIVLNGDAGTPSAIVLTNGTGLPAAGVVGTAAILGANIFTGAQSIASGTIVANAPAISITQTWNNGAVTFEGFTMDITATAAAAASNMFNVKVGGSSRLAARVNGDILIADLYPNAHATRFLGSTANQWLNIFGRNIFVDDGAAGGGILRFGNETVVRRIAAHTLGLINSTNAQKLQVYGSADGTPGSNYIAAALSCSATAVTLGVDALGSFANANVNLVPIGTGKVSVRQSPSAPDTIFSVQTSDGVDRLWFGHIGYTLNIGTGVQISGASGSIVLGSGSGAAYASGYGVVTYYNPKLRWPNSTPDLGTDRNAAGVLEINNGTPGTFRDLRLRNLINTLTTPASAAATGVAGTITADADFVYVCTATDTWKRVAIATW